MNLEVTEISLITEIPGPLLRPERPLLRPERRVLRPDLIITYRYLNHAKLRQGKAKYNTRTWNIPEHQKIIIINKKVIKLNKKAT